MLFLYNDHFTLENLSTGVKGFTTSQDVRSSTNLTTMLSHIATAMATKMPAFPLMQELNTQARWCSKAQ
jgi:hypothetical protein